MRIVDLVTWIASGLALVAVVAACWQLVRARTRARACRALLDRVSELASATESHAEQAEQQAEQARSQARWAWEQVKLATTQLEHARSEHQDSARAEQWEWAYAMTSCARDLADASRELVRIALDQEVAPHYRMSALRHYQQTSGRWQDTMAKALARTDPTLEVQHQVLTFTQVQHRLHGQIGVLLRAAETGSLQPSDPLAQQVRGAGQELETARRQLQRTLSVTLSSTSAATTQRSGTLNGNNGGAAHATTTVQRPAHATAQAAG